MSGWETCWTELNTALQIDSRTKGCRNPVETLQRSPEELERLERRQPSYLARNPHTKIFNLRLDKLILGRVDAETIEAETVKNLADMAEVRFCVRAAEKYCQESGPSSKKCNWHSSNQTESLATQRGQKKLSSPSLLFSSLDIGTW